jgi:hypothetical protein
VFSFFATPYLFETFSLLHVFFFCGIVDPLALNIVDL